MLIPLLQNPPQALWVNLINLIFSGLTLLHLVYLGSVFDSNSDDMEEDEVRKKYITVITQHYTGVQYVYSQWHLATLSIYARPDNEPQASFDDRKKIVSKRIKKYMAVLQRRSSLMELMQAMEGSMSAAPTFLLISQVTNCYVGHECNLRPDIFLAYFPVWQPSSKSQFVQLTVIYSL